MNRWILRLVLIVLGTSFILGSTYLFSFGLNPQRSPAQFPTNVSFQPDQSALGDVTALPGFAGVGDVKGAVSAATGPYVVNFFASWCQPCRLEHPYLLDFGAANPGRLMGLAYRDEAVNAANYLRTDLNPYAAVGADKDSINALNFGLTGVPETYLFAKDGTLLFRSPGPLIGALRTQFEQAWLEANQ